MIGAKVVLVLAVAAVAFTVMLPVLVPLGLLVAVLG